MKKIIYTITTALLCISFSTAQDLEANSESNVYSAKTTEENDANENNKVDEAKVKKDFRYYYYPNMQAYYDIEKEAYIYKDNGIWNVATELPTNYGGYSMFKNAKVKIVDYTGDDPQQFVTIHKKIFPYVAKGRFTYKTEPSDN